MNFIKEDNINLILPSNASLNVFPKNRGGNYSIQFEKTIILDKPMLCAVTDVILPTLVPYFKPSKIDFILIKQFAFRYGEIWKRDENILFSFHIEGEFLYDLRYFIQKIVKTLNEFNINLKIDEAFKKMIKEDKLTGLPRASIQKLEIKFDFKTNKLYYIPYKSISKSPFLEENLSVYPFFDDYLFSLFNFEFKYRIPNILNYTDEPQLRDSVPYFLLIWLIDNKNIFEIPMKNQGPEFISYPTLKGISKQLFEKNIDFFILCDIIDDSYINTVKHNFLRYCHCDSFGKLQNSFKPLLYFPVRKREFNCINLKIVDRNFNEIFFQKGSVIIILKLKALN